MEVTEQKPVCPCCKASELQHEQADRHQCQSCGYRVLIDDAGTVKDFMPWTTAGRKRRSGGMSFRKRKPARKSNEVT